MLIYSFHKRSTQVSRYALATSFFALLLLFASCQKPKDEPLPKGILSQEVMVQVLIDIHTAEAFVSMESQLSAQEATALFRRYEDKIFAAQGITREAYVASRSYYADNFPKMRQMYDAVVDSLNARKEVLAPPPSIDTK